MAIRVGTNTVLVSFLPIWWIHKINVYILHEGKVGGVGHTTDTGPAVSQNATAFLYGMFQVKENILKDTDETIFTFPFLYLIN